MRAILNDGAHAAVANLGVRPTVDGEKRLLEVHLLDFDGDLYDQVVSVRFGRKLRDERAFDGLDALKAQIARDIGEAKQLFAEDAAEV